MRRSVTIHDAKRRLGFDDAFKLRTKADWDTVQAVAKDKIVEARRSSDDAKAAGISEARAILKKHFGQGRVCPTCGTPKDSLAYECRLCSHQRRYYPKTLPLMKPNKEFDFSSTRLIPKRPNRSELAKALRKLVAGQVGDSFTTHKLSRSVKMAADAMGLEVLTACISGDEKKKEICVWRSDGLTSDEVNEIIQRRMAGLPVPDPKPCMPPAKTPSRVNGVEPIAAAV
jgi:hypothetical protein